MKRWIIDYGCLYAVHIASGICCVFWASIIWLFLAYK